MPTLTTFQKLVLIHLKRIGSIYAANATDSLADLRTVFTDGHNVPVRILNPDGRTYGSVGWPTVRALMAAKKLQAQEGNKFSLTGDRSASSEDNTPRQEDRNHD